MLKKDKEQFDMLEHVAKGVHVYGAERKNGRVLPRMLDRIDDHPRRPTRRKTTRRRR